MKRILISAFLIAGWAGAWAQGEGTKDSVVYKCVTLSAEDFNAVMKSGNDVLLIDVRLPAEFRAGKIENAVNIPLLKISDKKTGRLNKSSIILLYCTSGIRSCRAALKLHALGFKNLFSLAGGINGWKKAGLPVRKRLGKKV